MRNPNRKRNEAANKIPLSRRKSFRLAPKPMSKTDRMESDLDLKRLEAKLDKALAKETTESLTQWLKKKRQKSNTPKSMSIGIS